MKRNLLAVLLLGFGLAQAQTIGLQEFATGFTRPCEIASAGDTRLFVVEQTGRIRILNAGGNINSTPFLNISSLVSTGGERGLLGLAFHPQYAENGYFYINYTDTDGDTVIARYTRSSSNENEANPNSAQVIITIEQPQSNHNGGSLHFGRDGYLYIGMGDGGGADDPDRNGQNKSTLLGKMLRINVNADAPYTIPQDNPFVGEDGADEIWAYGLRNPWKFSFDKATGDLWIADVGQNAIEEINMAAPDESGINYGWRCYEGTVPYLQEGCPAEETYTDPVAEYNHTGDACSITGGYVYRGAAYQQLQGKYIFADYCSNRIGFTDAEGEITWSAAFSGNLATFGQDNDGELYVAGIANGTIYKITDTTASLPTYAGSTIKVYPNPAHGILNIESAAGQKININIYDLSGKLLYDNYLDTSAGKVDISRLSAGIYIAEINDGNSTIKHKIAVN